MRHGPSTSTRTGTAGLVDVRHPGIAAVRSLGRHGAVGMKRAGCEQCILLTSVYYVCRSE